MVYCPVLLLGEIPIVLLHGIQEQILGVLAELDHKVRLHPVPQRSFEHLVEELGPGHQQCTRRLGLAHQPHVTVECGQQDPRFVELVLAFEGGTLDGLQHPPHYFYCVRATVTAEHSQRVCTFELGPGENLRDELV